MSIQARPPRCAMATYSRKSSSNRDIRIKRVPKKDVLPIEEPEDSNRCGEESEIGNKSADKAVKKVNKPKSFSHVQIPMGFSECIPPIMTRNGNL